MGAGNLDAISFTIEHGTPKNRRIKFKKFLVFKRSLADQHQTMMSSIDLRASTIL